MKKAILLSLLLSACNATGPAYTGKEDGNLIVYRPDHILYGASYYSVEIGNGRECRLGNGGLFTTQIEGQSMVSAAKFSLPGTSRIKVKPGDFVKIEAKASRFFGAFGGGLIAGTAMEGLDSEAGPYSLTKVDPAKARQELQGLNRDCYGK